MSLSVPRRALLATPLVLFSRPVPASTLDRPPLRFRVLRGGSQIGTHRVSFATPGSGQFTALTEVDIAVRLAGITVFRFTHRFEEVWDGLRLRAVTSRQDRNGTVTEMQARAEGDALVVRGPDGTSRLPAQAAPLTWWDVERIEARLPLFDNAHGKPLRLAWTRTPLEGGGRRWACTGDRESAGEWSGNGTWTGWATKGDDGSTVTYERA
ncbi:MAG: hypothetical protein K2X74_07365 [Acetobacteraceae bacterium]|nr:hypothetical protein [Acetobacteraceae bacterium]